METKKVDLKAFTTTELTERLIVLQLNFNQRKDNLINDNELYIDYCKNLVNENFVNNNDYELCYNHLALFLLGNENNTFSKFLNNNK